MDLESKSDGIMRAEIGYTVSFQPLAGFPGCLGIGNAPSIDC